MKFSTFASRGAILALVTPQTFARDTKSTPNSQAEGAVPILSVGLGLDGSGSLDASIEADVHAGISLQFPNLTHTAESIARALEVRETFKQAYHDYKKYAWGYDELRPNTLDGTNPRNGWGATIIDALDTMIIMGLEVDFLEGVKWVSQVDFTTSKVDQTVSVFETTIRYLGGLLSAYALSPFHEKVLVEKAVELGNTLSLAWSKGTDVPYGFLNLSATEKFPIVDTSNIAEAGTLLLEFDELSTRSKNDSFRALADKSMRAIIEAPHPLPFLPAQGINPTNSSPVGDYATWQGGSDSYFEYLLKYALMTGNEDKAWISQWAAAVDTTISKLIRKDSVKGLTYPSDYSETNGGRIYLYSHLECFIGGNWMMGGRMLRNQTIIDIGLELIETCYNSYHSTATGIGPEGFCYIDAETGENRGCNISGADLEFYNEHGFAITSADYILRPEVLESYFYAYRITGDTKWQDRAWEAFQNVKKYCKGKAGLASLVDVNNLPPGQTNLQESFAFAEMFKYYYLIFAEPELIHLDRWVFNTEAHPFPIKKFTTDFAPIEPPTPTAPFVCHPGSLPTPSGEASLQLGINVNSPLESKVPSAKRHLERRRSKSF